jgi:hypothetical protein
MPSFQHDAIVQLLRAEPRLIPDLLQSALGVELPAHTQVTVADAALGRLAPAELRADLVVALTDPGAPPKLTIVTEVQLDVDPDKLFTWPGYQINTRLRERCDACVLVVTPSARVAAWASRPIRLGPGNEAFRVLVLGPAQMPEVRDPAVAAANPALAILATMAHGNEAGGVDVAWATIAAIPRLDSENATVYLELLGEALSPALRRAVKERAMSVSPDRPIPELLQYFVDAGEARGEARGAARTLLRILDFRGVPLTDAQREAILACRDEAQLDGWVDRAMIARTADDLFDRP